jgi:Mg2+-importing ATPase
MFFIGPVSSVFDFITFGVLLFVFHAPEAFFHTGWFLESLCTQTLVIHVIRTRKIPFLESKPSNALLITSVAILLLAFSLTASSYAKSFGFVPMPPEFFAVLALIVACYLFCVQFVKNWFAKKYGYY